GMNCKPSNNSNKKLVQARLPFKRLNPELKENQSHKRPCAHACPDVELSERENENESSPLLLCTGPPLVNGRGPLDGFLSRKRQVSTDENMVIDLTEEDVASVKPALSSNDKQQKKDRRMSSGKLKSIINPPKTQTVDSIPVDDDVTPEDMQNAEKADITRFLQKPKTQLAPKTLSAACGKFAPFEIKENMFLAPLTRVQFEDSDLEKLDEYLLNPDQKISGLKDWINQKPRCSGPTKTRKTDSPGDCKAVESPISDGVPDRSCHGPMKLLQFRENYRPAYWGTWSKKSSHISARCPFRQDKDLLDYEVDSDEEWEEEEPGESLSHSEGEDEEEGGEEDGEDDDGFFVPHGYLSDDEGALEEEDGGDLEKQKLQQKLKAKEWDELMSSKKKMKQLEPVVRGCVWEGQSQASELFHAYALCLIEPLVKVDTSPSPEEQLLKSQQETQLLGQLLPLLHGNVNSSKTIITEFQEFCRQQSSPSSPPTLYSNLLIQYYTFSLARLKLRRLIKNSAVYEKRSVYKRCCWYVHTEVLSQFGQVALPVPCQWTYLTTGAKEEAREEPQAATGSVGNSPPHHRALLTMKSSLTCVFICQQEAMEADGFQADTEEDDEDCVIVSTTKGGGKFGGFLKDGQQWPLC
uniref:Chromatin assembly factor 1, subunit A (p150) n=1 Tax=Neogobius melanostomus TaxID=47308 RepID=A0A8C6THB7_9GOBI